MGLTTSFPDCMKALDAAGLKIYLTNEFWRADHLERNNHALLESCIDGAVEMYLLLAHGANVDAGDLSLGWTPLMTAAVISYPNIGLTLDQFTENRFLCMRSLLAAGAAIDKTSHDGRTALMCAAWNFRLTEILVNTGANVNISDSGHTSALHFAIIRNNSDVVDLLMERGANINALTIQGWTPLHFACYNLHSTVLASLLHFGADINIVNNHGRTALQLAMPHPVTSPNCADVLQLMATCAQTRLEACSADWHVMNALDFKIPLFHLIRVSFYIESIEITDMQIILSTSCTFIVTLCTEMEGCPMCSILSVNHTIVLKSRNTPLSTINRAHCF